MTNVKPQLQSKKLLKGLFSLDHNFKLYIPSTINVNERTNSRQYVTQALQTFSDLFGGTTSYKAIGAWVSNDHGLVTENVTIVESYASAEQVENGLQTVLELANTIKHDLSQEAVSLEYDNKLYFI